MKKIVLVSAFALGLFSAEAQTIGLKIGPNATVTEFQSDFSFGYSGGIYIDQPLYKRLGLSSGVYFTQLRADVADYYICFIDCPERVDHRFDILEIPLDLTLDLTMQPENKLRIHLTGGYSFGQIIDKKRIGYYEDTKSREELELQGLVSQLNIIKVGVEGRFPLSDKIKAGIGAQYKHTNIYDRVYGNITNWNIFIKTGYNL